MATFTGVASTRKITVLISGSGTNLQALIDAQNTPALPNTEIVRVISNRKNAFGLQRAENAQIPSSYLALQPYLKSHPDKSREDYDEEVAKMIVQDEPDLVVLAGWMHILSQRFLDILHGISSVSGAAPSSTTHQPIPVINLHPALPGAFDGVNAIQRAYEAFQKGEITKAGVMVHRVIAEVDRGEPIVISELDFREGETLEEWEERVHREEWKVIVEGTRKALERVESWREEEREKREGGR